MSHRIRLGGLSLLLLLVIQSCVKNPSTGPQPQTPQIVAVFVPETAYLQDAEGIRVHARVEDPQGVDDIAGVACVVVDPQGQTQRFEMQDDGRSGDILPHDGQFTTRIPATAWSDTGTGRIIFEAEDREGNRAEADTLTVRVLPGRGGQPPFVAAVQFPDTVWADSSYQVQLLAEVRDPDGLQNVAEVRFFVYPPGRATPSLSGLLADAGSDDDGVAGNGVFGRRFSPDAFGIERGTHSLLVKAVDVQGNLSPGKIASFIIQTRLENLPPKILSISVPDTVSRSNSQPFVITCKVTDPNGLGDIARVFFNSFFPDGTPSSGNPFLLRDDGFKDQNGLGDAVAGDGEYSLAIAIGQSSQLGTFRFEFQAEDRGGLRSEIVVHRITVVQ